MGDAGDIGLSLDAYGSEFALGGCLLGLGENRSPLLWAVPGAESVGVELPLAPLPPAPVLAPVSTRDAHGLGLVGVPGAEREMGDPGTIRLLSGSAEPTLLLLKALAGSSNRTDFSPFELAEAARETGSTTPPPPSLS